MVYALDMKQVKKLVVSRETVRQLGSHELRVVAGGWSAISFCRPWCFSGGTCEVGCPSSHPQGPSSAFSVAIAC